MIAPTRHQAGFTIVEASISMMIVSVIVFAAIAVTQREAVHVYQFADEAGAELGASTLLDRLESELEFAQIWDRRTKLYALTSADEQAGVTLRRAEGIPDVGYLSLSAGTQDRELVAYRGLNPITGDVEAIERMAPNPDSHPKGAAVRWEGVARRTGGTADGVSREATGEVPFAGSGVGLLFRVPVDPAGGMEFVQSGVARWGAAVRGNESTTAWSCFYFQRTRVLDESTLGADLNRDGDQQDSFDVGRIRKRSWLPSGSSITADDRAIGPASVVQERGNWGGDLDGDGFEDPMFLWDPQTGYLRIRLFYANSGIQASVRLQRLESSMLLPNAGGE